MGVRISGYGGAQRRISQQRIDDGEKDHHSRDDRNEETGLREVKHPQFAVGLVVHEGQAETPGLRLIILL